MILLYLLPFVKRTQMIDIVATYKVDEKIELYDFTYPSSLKPAVGRFLPDTKM